MELIVVAIEGSTSLAAVPGGGGAPPVDVLPMPHGGAVVGREQADTGLGAQLSNRMWVNVGQFTRQLATIAEDRSAALVVIGARPPMDGFLLASLATPLYRRVSCPLVVVPRGVSLSE
jgi:hypothetical protein